MSKGSLKAYTEYGHDALFVLPYYLPCHLNTELIFGSILSTFLCGYSGKTEVKHCLDLSTNNEQKTTTAYKTLVSTFKKTIDKFVAMCSDAMFFRELIYQYLENISTSSQILIVDTIFVVAQT